jgi:hypothetical protein
MRRPPFKKLPLKFISNACALVALAIKGSTGNIVVLFFISLFPKQQMRQMRLGYYLEPLRNGHLPRIPFAPGVSTMPVTLRNPSGNLQYCAKGAQRGQAR